MYLYDKAVINDKKFQIVRVGMSKEEYILASIYIKDVIDVLRSAGVIQSDVVQKQSGNGGCTGHFIHSGVGQ